MILGGNRGREICALKTCKRDFPQARIWLTGPELSEDCVEICRDELELDMRRVRIDYRAVDTLSNFTTLAEDVLQGRFRTVAILTSNGHMLRGFALARIILPRYGVKSIKIVAVKQNRDVEESFIKIFRDIVRAWFWLAGIDPTYMIIKKFYPERLIHNNRKIRNLTYSGESALTTE